MEGGMKKALKTRDLKFRENLKHKWQVVLLLTDKDFDIQISNFNQVRKG